MSVGGKENSTQQHNEFKVPREAISPETENIIELQAEAREKINFLTHYLTKGVIWPQSEDPDFDKRTLIMALNILRPGLPSIIVDSISADVLSFRLKVIREVVDVLKRMYPNSPRLGTWEQYDYASEVEPAWKEVQTLFSLQRESLGRGLEKVEKSVKLLYEHDPVALKNLLAWHIDMLDTDTLQLGLFK